MQLEPRTPPFPGVRSRRFCVRLCVRVCAFFPRGGEGGAMAGYADQGRVLVDQSYRAWR